MKSVSGNVRRKLSVSALWLLAVGWTGFSLFLSWQSWVTTAALAVSLPRDRQQAWSCFAAALACSALAAAAEAGKLYIPGRHLQWDETLLNVIGSILGVGLIWAISALRRQRG